MAADPKHGTLEFERLDSLVSLVHAYEERRHPIAPPGGPLETPAT